MAQAADAGAVKEGVSDKAERDNKPRETRWNFMTISWTTIFSDRQNCSDFSQINET
jgi:hypothetical protein